MKKLQKNAVVIWPFLSRKCVTITTYFGLFQLYTIINRMRLVGKIIIIITYYTSVLFIYYLFLFYYLLLLLLLLLLALLV